jgi:segregation and condensation protein A
MPYKVKLDAFEGPLDLLLFLIKKSEVDIYDIPVADITQQYLEYIEIIKLLDIEAASDFILMAATLMRIKAQMLLPKPETEEVDDIDDPRQELVYRLLEYKRFKDIALGLGDREREARKTFPRGHYKFEHNGVETTVLDNSDVTLFDLVAAFKKVVETRPKVTVHRVEEIDVTLEKQIQFVLDAVEKNGTIEFVQLFKTKQDKVVLIVTFIAILELIKQQKIKATQTKTFGQIIIKRVNG